MIDYEIIRKVLEEKTGLARFNASHSNIILYCPWCELGSKKNHGHLYLECADRNQMPVFHCFKCEDRNKSKGTLVKLLKVLGIPPHKYLPKEILKSKFSRSYNYYKKDLRINRLSIQDQNFDNYKLKRQYLHYRLGFDCDLEKIPRLILNIREFVRNNNIDLKERKKFLEYYERSFVGFISDNGTVLILRNIDSKSSFRYVKIPLTENNNYYFKDIYSINDKKPKRDSNTIILCEGIFDLLISMNSIELQELKNKSCLSAAVLGCGYKKAIAASLDKCKLTAANFVILSDSDKKENYYYKFNQNPSVFNLEIYWNKFGGDFGKLPIGLTRKAGV